MEITLLSGGAAWQPPADADAAIAYYQPGGSKGLYNKLADGTPAIAISGNVVTVILAPQMLTMSGTVQATLVFDDAKLNRLTTFPFSVSVASNPAAGAQKVEDYLRLQWLEDKLEEYLTLAKESGIFDGKDGDSTAATEAAIAAKEAAQKAEDAAYGRLKNAVITATGDSITAQERNFAKLIAEEYSMTYENVARGGGTVASGILDLEGGHRPCICDTIGSMRQDADIILLSGGVNDQVGLNHELEYLGKLTDGFDQTLNKATLYGALEYMLRQAVFKWSNKTILYVLPHRMTQNLDYRTAALAACKKYGVPVVDIMESTMDFYTLPEFKNLYTSNGDGWHPNEEGFRTFYVPQILDAICRHFRGKGDTITLVDSNMPDVICVNTDTSSEEIFTPDIAGFIRTNGTISTSANYLRTDYLPLAGKSSMEYNVFVSGGAGSQHSTWALFDESRTWLASSDDCANTDFWHVGPTGNDIMVGFKHNERSLSDLLETYPAAAYVVFSTYVSPDYETLVDNTGTNIGWGSEVAYIKLK